MNLRAVAAELAKTMACNCDLDNWEPEKSTGHSWVCGIHKKTKAIECAAKTPAPEVLEDSNGKD